MNSYTVQPGDTLSKLAKQFLGNAGDYMKIFNANKDQLSDPNLIKVGQVLKIPRPELLHWGTGAALLGGRIDSAG